MPQLLWDASALVKKYVDEVGSDTADELFAAAGVQMASTFIGYAETAALLRRRYNSGNLSSQDFGAARFALRAEVLDNSEFELLSVTDADVLTGIALTDRHNLNSTDAAILAAFLRDTRTSGTSGAILIAADQRLLRAAELEGLTTLNPERVSPGDVSVLLGTS